jgi:uncharacterized membrane protein YphA (DoxX/SURF4 family)
MKKRNRIIGILVLLLAIFYPIIVKNTSPDHFNESGDFLTYIFTPILALFGIFSMINLKSGIYYSRIIVGSVFVVSGLIKANDTLGFSYKLEEYFEPGALGWSNFFDKYEFFNGVELWMAILICIGEVILGLALLYGAKFKLTLVFIMGMLVFFAFLTFYTAQCDPTSTYTVIEKGIAVEKPVQCVLDCGCFGDALKGSVGRSLTPWESFYKDLVLLILTLFLYLGWGRIKLNNERRDKVILISALAFIAFFGGYVFGWWMPLSFSGIVFGIYLAIKWFYTKAHREWLIALAMALSVLSFSLYTFYYLPVKDYRPYAIGNNLKELRKTSDDIKADITQVEYEKILKSYTVNFENEKKAILTQFSDTAANYETIIDSITTEIASKYEDIAWAIADSVANDSMVRGNLLPPVYAVNYLLRNKKTKEDKAFTSIEYLEQKLWNEWETVYQLKHNETGEVVKVLSTEYDMEEWEAKNYSKLNPNPFKVSDGYEPKIPADFDFNDEEANHHILNSKEYLILVIAYNLEHPEKYDYTIVNELYSFTESNDEVSFYAATSTDYLADEFKKINNIEFDFLSADEKILKTIVRANPGMILLKDGVVYGKWSSASMPTPKELEKYISKIGK